MHRRRCIALLAASAALPGCALFQRREARGDNDGFIVREAPVAQANMTEIIPAGDTMFISGTINEDTATAFAAVKEGNPELKQVVFLDVDGPIGGPGGIALGRAVRAAGMRTHLRNDSRVSGGAVDAFLGGTQRTLEDGAVIAAVKGAPDLDAHRSYVTEMTGGDGYARFANEFGGRRRPRPMTIAEIGAMGVISGPEASVLAEG